MGKVQFVLLFIGTNLAFFPQHLLGLDGMVRRIVDYADNPGWTELNFLSTIGAFIIAVSVLPFLWNVFITLREPRTAPDDPWDGNTLEWATTSPPPPYNFDSLPPIRSERPLFDLKHGAVAAHAVALPAGPGETHDELRADSRGALASRSRARPRRCRGEQPRFRGSADAGTTKSEPR